MKGIPLRKKAAHAFGRSGDEGPNGKGESSQGLPLRRATGLHGAKRRKIGRRPHRQPGPILDGSGIRPVCSRLQSVHVWVTFALHAPA
jgi:hypothetical protein